MYGVTFKLMKKYRIFFLHFTILVLNVFYCDGKCGTGYKLVAPSVIEERCVLYGSDSGMSFLDCTKACNHIKNCVHFNHQGRCIYRPYIITWVFIAPVGYYLLN